MNGLSGTPLPVAASCTSNWTSLCRITIHYEMHIHPMWGMDASSMRTTTAIRP